MRAAAVLACALVAATAATAAARSQKAAPAPYVDEERGFQVTFTGDWRRVEQDTGGGAREPVLKATRDASNQWLVVLVERGPTDDVTGGAKGAPGAEAVEAGFKGAPGYKRLSLKTREVAYTTEVDGKKKAAKLPAVDLWFVMERDGKPVVVGVRALVYKSYLLTLVVDHPGKKKPDTATRKLLESFKPA